MGPLPLHYQIAEELRRRILAGEIPAGSRLPSETDLMATFGVSRGTVRQALAGLRSDGLVVGRRGRPPEVVERRLEQPFSELVSFSAWIESIGRTPSGRVVEFAPRPADVETAEALDVAVGATVYHLIRVRYADGEPLLIERTTFPNDIGRLLSAADLEHSSIYARLADHGLPVERARQLVDAIAAPAADARLLGIPARAPLLRVRRHSFGATGRPLEWSEDRYRADRLTLQIDNSAARPAVQRQLVSTAER
jgi:GntR family transcriptional regulator